MVSLPRVVGAMGRGHLTSQAPRVVLPGVALPGVASLGLLTQGRPVQRNEVILS